MGRTEGEIGTEGGDRKREKKKPNTVRERKIGRVIVVNKKGD